MIALWRSWQVHAQDRIKEVRRNPPTVMRDKKYNKSGNLNFLCRYICISSEMLRNTSMNQAYPGTLGVWMKQNYSLLTPFTAALRYVPAMYCSANPGGRKAIGVSGLRWGKGLVPLFEDILKHCELTLTRDTCSFWVFLNCSRCRRMWVVNALVGRRLVSP